MTPAAAGTLHAFAGLLAGGVAVALVLAFALIASGDHSISIGSAGAALLSLGFACVSTATIVALSGGLRPPTLALVFAIATAWTATALPLWFGVPATALTAVVLAFDARRGGPALGGRVPVAALAAAGAAMLLTAAATAKTRPEPTPVTPPQPSAAAPLRQPRPAHRERAKRPAPRHAAAPHATAIPGDAATPEAPAVPGATAPASRPAPDEFVRTYYAALDGHRFADAWKVLSPAVKARFGGLAHWRAGYATTLASVPGDVRVSSAADGTASVRLTLLARDRTSCGKPLERRFASPGRSLRPRRAGR